jgi:hypothetical protein
MQQTWIFFAIPVVVVSVGFLVALTRRGSVTGTRIGSRCHEIVSAGDPATMFERLRGIGAPYRIDDEDARAKILVLSSPPTFATWGFLYPVVVTPAAGGGSRIQIGITSRFIQFGPLVTRAHANARHAIENTVGIPVARVA